MPIALFMKKPQFVDYTVGDIVKVIDPGKQFSHWDNLNFFILGVRGCYRIPYKYNDEGDIVPIQNETLKQWKVVGIIETVSAYGGKKFIYHIRDKEEHDSFIGPKGLKLIRRPRPESIGIAEIKRFVY